MNRAEQILCVLYAGVAPIIIISLLVIDYWYWLWTGIDMPYCQYFNEYVLAGITIPMIFLSIRCKYCKYHIYMMIYTLPYLLLSVIQYRHGMHPVWNIGMLISALFITYNLIIVFTHIAQQITRHTTKIRLFIKALYYGILQRINRPNRRDTQDSTLGDIGD